MSRPRVVILDNYDSYTYNLFQRVGEQTGVEPIVFRNDKVTLDELRALAPSHVIVSPGPGSPEDPAYFGVCRAAILELGRHVPVLGVCLGHQGIGHVFGGEVVRAPEPMHGKIRHIVHDGTGVFAGLPSPIEVMRYHSLVVEPASVPRCLRVTARSTDGLVMGLSHATYPIHGVQFHPESIGTPDGARLLGNFLAMSPATRVAQEAA